MAIRRTNQEWETLLERYEHGNIIQRAFCEQRGLSLSTFFAKRSQRHSATQSAPVGFVRAEVVEKTMKYQAQIATANMTLLVNDVELSIPQGTPVTYLAELIGALS
ncbi:TPA: IS66 family insertion sequence element accessory protein TnpB [Vibrio vulnificus]|uniref:Putative transposase n=2 Tax=Vibrio TaxID=662 RepID=A0A0H4A1G2_9VIBR|nr:putative transposase [Vibrio sp. FF_286]AKN40039.1 putative transposase [Vibrio tasmaniensis]EHI9240433.1 IS66 family insertion sequence element accessory protein TnpB [Vibrio vulnificus]HDY8019438.1 IS66 family insertion sequence element accessory protein TnpB [Vibrio vulnificus]